VGARDIRQEGNEMEPFTARVDFENGIVTPFHNKTERRLAEIKGFFSDAAAAEEALAEDNRVVYEAYEIRTPSRAGEMSWCTTIIHPGRVGREYHMTKGHFHRKDDSTEMYIGVKGTGCLVCQTRENEFISQPIQPGSVSLVPALWAHRVVNTGEQDLIIMAVYASDAGHDYGFIEHKGFVNLVCEDRGGVVFEKNPKY
jgi:glucose-6-phosphate isomerase, archaeal